jgi:hypothetical protein
VKLAVRRLADDGPALGVREAGAEIDLEPRFAALNHPRKAGVEGSNPSVGFTWCAGGLVGSCPQVEAFTEAVRRLQSD